MLDHVRRPVGNDADGVVREAGTHECANPPHPGGVDLRAGRRTSVSVVSIGDNRPVFRSVLYGGGHDNYREQGLLPN